MPYVHIRITDEGVTEEQKSQLIEKTTDALSTVLDKDPATTFVIIEEVPLQNWGIGGLPVEAYRNRKKHQ
ncbi:MAG: 4-oxalocrotonate tautomerase family protein [Cellvibrionaceae bacterium]